MSLRKIPLITGETYHVFNHAIDYRDLCSTKREYERLLLTMWFYQPLVIQMKLSHYLVTAANVRQSLRREINQKTKMVEVQAFSLMPNHYHLLIKQLTDKGITTYLSNVQNSYSKYFNTKHERKGGLFVSPFHAKRIHTQEQFLHVARYIHLQRYSSGFIDDLNLLKNDPYSSLNYYFSTHTFARPWVDTEQLAKFFNTSEKHWQFIKDQADYQRSLDQIKHLVDE